MPQSDGDHAPLLALPGIMAGPPGHLRSGSRDDLFEVAERCTARLAEALHLHGLRLSDLVKLHVCHVPRPQRTTHDILAALALCLKGHATVTFSALPLRGLWRSREWLQLDAWAWRDSLAPRAHARLAGSFAAHDCLVDALRVGDLAWTSAQLPLDAHGEPFATGSLPQQNRRVLERLEAVLSQLGLSPDDIVQFNTWRAPPRSRGDYLAAASRRFGFLARASAAVTGISVPDLLPDGASIQIECVVAHPDAGARERLCPEGHWDWPSATPYAQGVRAGQWVFVGGQAPLGMTGEVLFRDDFVAQAARTRDYLREVLTAGGVSESDIVSSTTYCTRNADVPGPARLVDELAYFRQSVEMDAIAWKSHGTFRGRLPGAVRRH